MKKTIFFWMILSATLAHAQTYVAKGKIEFEKTVNVHKILDENFVNNSSKSILDAFKKSYSATGVLYFDLYFNNDKSLYKPGKEAPTAQRSPDWVSSMAGDNIVFDDMSTGTTTAQKNVYENTFLVKDSLRTLNWKISNDTRTIAGFECRKASAVMMDSVFVVAFFTEQILCSSGPEGFNGLPGMILGVVIPRLHTTWYATKLELSEVGDAQLIAPKKGKPTTNSQLEKQLKDLFRNNSNANRTIWQALI